MQADDGCVPHMQPSVVITIDVLHLVFSAFGYVCKIATFEKQAGFQALIQYPDPATAETVRVQACAATSWPEGTRLVRRNCSDKVSNSLYWVVCR